MNKKIIKLSTKQLKKIINEATSDITSPDECVEVVANHAYDSFLQTFCNENNDSLNDQFRDAIVEQLDKVFSLEQISIDYDVAPEIAKRTIEMLTSSSEFKLWLSDRIESSLKMMY